VKYAEQNVNEATMLGYHSWAKPFVKVMKKNPLFTLKAIPLAIEWSKHSAYEIGIREKDSLVGKILLETAIPLNENLGNMMIKDGNEDYEFDEEFVERMSSKYLKEVSSDMNLDEFKENIKSAFKEVEKEYLENKDSYEHKKSFWSWFF